MKCEMTNLEIETIYNRIINGDINLQPDFQRGEIWSLQKKKKLIDSIFRSWKIPPIHVVSIPSSVDEVLDGQQRLATIRDFIDNKLSIDGNFSPIDEEISKYDGYRYCDLPIESQRFFKQYSIIFIRLTEFRSEEPAELFYRLNQPATLTSAEQRNAFIGEPRNQIRELVKLFIDIGATRETIGFSNSRLAYDEVISKFCYTIQAKTLKKKVTAATISEQYRNNVPFHDSTIVICRRVLQQFMRSILYSSESTNIGFQFNKATLYSWFVFFKTNAEMDNEASSNLVYKFEASREFIKGKRNNLLSVDSILWNEYILNQYPFLEVLLNTFNQRASMGSTDALSIIYRDIIIQTYRDIIYDCKSELLFNIESVFKQKQSMSSVLELIVSNLNWGGIF